jgi:hypothetical protein
MSSEYRNNHYVPRWYQKLFFLPKHEKRELYYLSLNPGVFTDSRGIIHQKKPIRKQGTKFCFAKEDLYTTRYGLEEYTEIEKYFFGEIDNNGRYAVDYFTHFKHPSANGSAFRNMTIYMSTQKLRTPKGLEWLSDQVGTQDKQKILSSLLYLRQMYCAIWTECVWQIADASESETKFIISDHPVTVYNRVCAPKTQWCLGANDPDIIMQGTHTIFPLSLDKILIMTNLSWVRNPYQPEIRYRPNPNLFRSAVFKFTDIQTHRHLSKQEVTEINYIIKRRAFQYIAAAKEEWLYPEKSLAITKWDTFGNGYLLMPDPRPIHLGGQVYIGHHDGTTSAYDEYGRRPWQSDYNKENETDTESDTLYRFKGEFARLYGPYRRGRTFEAMSLDKECDDNEFHNYLLNLEKKHKKKRK